MVTGITLHSGRNKTKTLTFVRVGKSFCIVTNDGENRASYKLPADKMRAIVDNNGHFVNLSTYGAENLLVMHKKDEIIFRNDHSYWATSVGEMDRIMEHLVLPYGDTCRERFANN